MRNVARSPGIAGGGRGWLGQVVLPYWRHVGEWNARGQSGVAMLRRMRTVLNPRRGVRALRSRLADALGVGRRREYAIAIWGGEHPCSLRPRSGTTRPALTRRDVRDVPAAYVADPFLVRQADGWYLFFEVLRADTGRGEIAVARSHDLKRWSYLGVALTDDVHLSYPHVFVHDGTPYLIPETHEAHEVRLYRASSFPLRWECVGTIIAGAPFVDATTVHHDGRWYLFVGTVPHGDFRQRDLRLFHADRLTGPWLEHPASPIVQGDGRVARPAGGVVSHPEGLLRFVQDCRVTYGHQVFAFVVEELGPSTYRERPYAAEPIVGPGSFNWNRGGMHHVDAHRVGDEWVGAVDGWAQRLARVTPSRR